MHIIEPQAEESSPVSTQTDFPMRSSGRPCSDEVAGSVDPATYDDDFDYDCTDSDDDALDDGSSTKTWKRRGDADVSQLATCSCQGVREFRERAHTFHERSSFITLDSTVETFVSTFVVLAPIFLFGLFLGTMIL